MKLWFNPNEPDWNLINPGLRNWEFDYHGPGGEFHTSNLRDITVYNNGSITRMQDCNQANHQQNYNFIANESPGAWSRNFHVPKHQKLAVYVTSRSANSTVVDFEFFLNEGSELELRYLNNAEHRQSHARFRINHCGANSRSDIRTATVAHKDAASTAMVDVSMPAGCAGSVSRVKCYNWTAGGRVGSLPIISVAEPNVEATHGNVMYSLDKEAVFLLQLRGLDETTARGEVLYGQLISGMESEVDLTDWFDARQCLGDVVC
jgi:Fe-S cluster assembly scaffold protein SufB